MTEMLHIPIMVPEMDKALCRPHMLQLVPREHASGVTWQARWAIVAVQLAKHALEDTRLLARLGDAFDPTVASIILAEVAPLCCYIGPGKVGEIREVLVHDIALIKRVALHSDGPKV